MSRRIAYSLLILLLAPSALAQGIPVPGGTGGGTEPAEQVLPDLAVTSLDIDPDQPDYAHPVTLCATFQNYGNGDPTPFDALLVFDHETVLVKRYTQFPENGERLCTDVRTDSGWHTFEAIADSDDEVQEMSEDNNRRARTFLVGDPPRPDLGVELLFSQDPPRRGETLAVTARVKNLGDAVANASVVHFFDNGRLVARRDVPPVPGGGDRLVSVVVDTDRLPAGEHAIRAFVDATDLVQELNEANNEATRSFSLAKLPDVDLALVDVTWTTPARAGAPVNLTARLANLGEKDAGTFLVRFILDNRSLMGAPRVTALASGVELNVSIEWSGREPGDHGLTVVVDPTGEVPENVRANNIAWYPFEVRPASDEPPAPNLVVERVLVVPREPRPGQPVNVTAVVRNAGTMRADAFDVAFVVDGVPAGTSRFTSLSAGGVVAAVATFTPAEGERVVLVTADAARELAEANETDNDRELVFRAGEPAPPPPPPDDSSNEPPTEPSDEPPVDDGGSGGADEPPVDVPSGTADVRISSVAWVPRTLPNGTFDPRFAAQVYNAGEAVAGPFTIRWYVDDVLVGELPAGGLSPRREVGTSWGSHRAADFVAPSPGEHVLRVAVVVEQDGVPVETSSRETTFTVDAPEEPVLPQLKWVAVAAAAAAAVGIYAWRRRSAAFVDEL